MDAAYAEGDLFWTDRQTTNSQFSDYRNHWIDLIIAQIPHNDYLFILIGAKCTANYLDAQIDSYRLNDAFSMAPKKHTSTWGLEVK